MTNFQIESRLDPVAIAEITREASRMRAEYFAQSIARLFAWIRGGHSTAARPAH